MFNIEQSKSNTVFPEHLMHHNNYKANVRVNVSFNSISFALDKKYKRIFNFTTIYHEKINGVTKKDIG